MESSAGTRTTTTTTTTTIQESSVSVRKCGAEPPCSKRPKIDSSEIENENENENENEESVADVTTSVGSSSSGDGASSGTDGSEEGNQDDSGRDDDDDGEGEENDDSDSQSQSQSDEPLSAGEQEEEEQQQQQQQEGEQEEEEEQQQPRNRLDEEDLDLEADETNSDDENLFQQILAAARAGRIPLEYLAASGIHLDFDDGPVDYPFDSPPTSIRDVANFIRSENCQRILVLAGAGMSVASGIPDFRSSNGLYATLEPNKLTATPEQVERIEADPSYSLDQHLFMENPLPCLEVNREFILGVRERRWKATLAHRFVEMLRTKVQNKEGGGKLVRLYTQNIDGLEDQCEGIGHQRRIAVHGSMDEAECATCGASMDFDVFCEKVRTQIKDILGTDVSAPAESTPIVCESCGAGTVKPAIVLFRSRLPEVFFNNVPPDVRKTDLLLVLGTSLAVAPANSLVMRIPRSSMRVLMNREPVGWRLGFDSESNERDFFAEGDCENTALDFMEELGWLDELEPLLERNEFPEASGKLLRERLERVRRNQQETDSTGTQSQEQQQQQQQQQQQEPQSANP
eukprot:jgi/Psemu1/326008/estExt_fgenesh1_pg.C_3090016